MRFMIMHKNDPQTEAGEPPPLDLVHKMGAFIGEYAETGRFIDGAGLGASATRTRLILNQCVTHDLSCPVADGDEIAFLPPMSGG